MNAQSRISELLFSSPGSRYCDDCLASQIVGVRKTTIDKAVKHLTGQYRDELFGYMRDDGVCCVCNKTRMVTFAITSIT